MAELLVRVVPPAIQDGNFVEYSGAKLIERFADRAQDLGDVIRQVTTSLGAQISEIACEHSISDWPLNEVSMTFSLDLEAESGVVLARAKAAAGFEVALTWTRTS